MAVITPYANVDIATTARILGVTHQHLSHSSANHARAAYNNIYETGVRHFAISRYRPSLITYPFDYENDRFIYVANPFGETEPVEELVEDYAVMIDIEDDVVGCPNAEHVYPLLWTDGGWQKMNYVHINGLGSFYQSCLTPNPDYDSTNIGLRVPYEHAIRAILAELQFSDGGGVIINHPTWTYNSQSLGLDVQCFTCDCLDYDARVLGTDILEGGHQERLAYSTYNADKILKTGRRCWLFGQGDWNQTRGRNELLIPAGLTREETEHEVLKAYRKGRFFARWANTALTVTAVGVSDGIFSITTEHADGIKVYVDGVETDHAGNSATVELAEDATYVRAMAYIERDDDPDWSYDENDTYKDLVFTNPIILNPKTYNYSPAYMKPASASSILWR